MRDIEVLKFSDDRTSSEFTIQNPLSHVSNRDGLAQRIIKLMFTQIGSDTYSPDTGTVFYELMKVYREDELENVRSTFPVILKKLEELVKREQTEDLVNGYRLYDDEILDSLVLKSYTWDEVYGGWILVLEVNTRSGDQVYVQIP
jgi:hypothetical protein